MLGSRSPLGPFAKRYRHRDYICPRQIGFLSRNLDTRPLIASPFSRPYLRALFLSERT